ncbi:MAG: hypothetical protein ACI4ED_07405 [Suilimivivens sp.]
MKGKYQFKYVETQEVLTDFMKVHGLIKISKTYRIVVATGGLFVLTIMLMNTDILKRGAGEILLFALKFLVIWALAFVVAEFFGKTVGRKLEFLAATGDGETIYEKRLEKWKEPASVRVDFYEDSWTSMVHGNSQTLYYKNVERIIESEEVVALIVNVETGGQRFFGFTKKGLQNAEIEEFMSFLSGKCAGVKKGIEKVSIKEKKRK